MVPRTVIRQISGTSFFDPQNVDPKDRADEESPVLKVRHDPGCNYPWSHGNDGNDSFFNSKKLPKEAKLVKGLIHQIDPSNPQFSWDHFAKALLDPFTPFKLLGVKLLQLFDSKAGSYVVQVSKEPTPENPLTIIHWENACVGSYSGVPVEYFATFFIEVPEDLPL
jgi:hypothetical protein